MLVLFVGYKFFELENTDHLSNEKKYDRKASNPKTTNLSVTWEGEDPFKSSEQNSTVGLAVAKKIKKPVVSQVDTNISEQKKKKLVKTRVLTKEASNTQEKISSRNSTEDIEGDVAISLSKILERREQEKELFRFNKSNPDKQAHHITKDEETDLLNENLREFKQHEKGN